jgi:GDPmannose 4,6-dehydratase
MARKVALITGVTGQAGSYLAEHLLGLGYEVHGTVRRSSQPNLGRVEHLLGEPPRLRLHSVDLLDGLSLARALREVRPSEVYNLAAQSFVPESFRQPLLTAEVTALGVTRLLEAIRLTDDSIRFYQASSSEMFGQATQEPQTESTPFHPRSPYGVAKCYGHWATVNYRESYGIFACSGICFNHESERRGPEFVTRKVTLAAARIKAGLQSELVLGDLEAERDWGFAGDYVKAMHLMLQADTPDDYVVATGEKHSVQQLVEAAFARVGLDWTRHVRTSDELRRPADVAALRGDASKIAARLGWRPRVGFERLIEMMVDHDLALCAGEKAGAAPQG